MWSKEVLRLLFCLVVFFISSCSTTSSGQRGVASVQQKIEKANPSTVVQEIQKLKQDNISHLTYVISSSDIGPNCYNLIQESTMRLVRTDENYIKYFVTIDPNEVSSQIEMLYNLPKNLYQQSESSASLDVRIYISEYVLIGEMENIYLVNDIDALVSGVSKLPDNQLNLSYFELNEEKCLDRYSSFFGP